MEVFDLQHGGDFRGAAAAGKENAFARGRAGGQPTEPSSETSSSFLASTANSIGSSRNTFAEAVDDHRHRVFLADATGAAVEQLVVGDLGGGGLVLDGGARVLHLDVGKVCAPHCLPISSESHWVVARAIGVAVHPHQAAVGVLASAGADALADDLALGALADVDHLGAGVGLLAVMGQRHGWNSPTESSPSSTQDGYFQVIAEPVSTWVQVTLLRAPRHSARLVTKL